MKLIDKDALTEKLRERRIKNRDFGGSPHSEYGHEEDEILSLINSLEVKEVGVWKTIDNINLPQADKNKIYCVLSKKNKYLLARVINHPHDDELLQWKCTEFPFHRYDMCEGDKYMQIA